MMAGRGKARALAFYLLKRTLGIAAVLVLAIIPYYAFTKRLPHRSTMIAMAIGTALSPVFYWLLWRVFGVSLLRGRRTTKWPDV